MKLEYPNTCVTYYFPGKIEDANHVLHDTFWEQIGWEWVHVEKVDELISLLYNVGADSLYTTEVRASDGCLLIEHRVRDKDQQAKILNRKDLKLKEKK